MTTQTSFSLLQWYDHRPQRERVALLVAAVVLLMFLFNLLILSPFSQQKEAAQRIQNKLTMDLAELKNRKGEILGRVDHDPDQQNLLRLDVLEQEATRLQQQLKNNIVNLVAPQEMPGLLKDLLTQQKKLQLLSLENLAPELLELNEQGAEAVETPTLYRHRLQLEFSGDYLTLLKYLHQLEELPRSMVWEEVEVISEDYPQATVRLQVYTLSLTEGWIGG
ncbi:MSHA biogenesis protein MshJ [Desulfuromusa kysingii]|uniref:MSHA biogenesis protein MshJ n=1 Tax=Desulfuromusa kysingii TaxID=37625 RepID=A0A1H3WTB3_9BACT|nr:type II secretion system protein GspM [Desulfuromusa kysingii]SDZ90385.1 MSHA biogenesis protein MshJ [Desulfuromusa kysingii]